MDVHEFRLQLLLGGRPEGIDPDVKHLAGVSAQSGDRVRGSHRLSRLAYSTGAAIPVPEVVVRDPALRGGGFTSSCARARAPGAAVRNVGAAGWPLRVGRTSAIESDLFPAQRRRHGESSDHGSSESERRLVSHAYEIEREIDVEVLCGTNEYEGEARGAGVEADQGRSSIPAGIELKRWSGVCRPGVSNVPLPASINWSSLQTSSPRLVFRGLLVGSGLRFHRVRTLSGLHNFLERRPAADHQRCAFDLHQLFLPEFGEEAADRFASRADDLSDLFVREIK